MGKHKQQAPDYNDNDNKNLARGFHGFSRMLKQGKKSILHYAEEKMVDFYGEQVDTVRPYETYRMLYGMTLFQKQAKEQVMKDYGIENEWDFDFLMFAAQFKYFRKKDAYSFFYYGNKRADKFFTKTCFFRLQDLNLIEYVQPINRRFKKRIQKHKKNQNVLYRITPKGSQFMKDYVDYLMFKKIIPPNREYMPEDLSIYDLGEKKNEGYRRVHYVRNYVLYHSLWDYINTVETENPLGYNEEEVDLMMEDSSSDYKFSAFFYIVTAMEYNMGKVKRNTLQIMRKFLTGDIFNDTGYKYQKNPQTGKLMIHEEGTDERYHDSYNEFLKLIDDDILNNNTKKKRKKVY